MQSIQHHEIRIAAAPDHDGIWRIIEPVIRAGDVYALPASMSREEALAYWFAPTHTVFVAESGGRVPGTYYLRANQKGGGDHGELRTCNVRESSRQRYRRSNVS